MKYLTAVAGVLVVCALIVSCASSGSKDTNKTDVDVLTGYASWPKVNSETITGDATGVLGKAHEGSDGFREVYANAVAQRVSSGSADLPYPLGSIIVKEAYKNAGGSKGDMTSITVMVKREDGYDTENGNWEYLMLTPAMKVQNQGLLGGCISCHAAADNDWVFTDNR